MKTGAVTNQRRVVSREWLKWGIVGVVALACWWGTPAPAEEPLTVDRSIRPEAPFPTVARWRWLANTYWYVPAFNLPAIVFDAAKREAQPLLDQTVFHITDYRDGYFWGKTVVQLGPFPVNCLSLVGSVTPEGRVLLTFAPAGTATDADITQGLGEMRLRFGQWTMENQMTSGQNARFQVAHWAYMIQVRPDQPSWQSLPGVHISVDEFLAQCPN